MSAEAMKRAALIKIEGARSDMAFDACERTGDDYGQMKLAQGIVEGLRQAMVYIEQAYKELGN